jgi:protein-L-isoaspartate(D-aspartate) O-methyltransferase
MFDELEMKINDPAVREALAKVPREEFVPVDYWYIADEDRPLPIGYEQTISQPFIVALMTELLELQASDRVLEIGTGSGYQTAILAEIAKEVYTVEVISPLAERGRRTLTALGYDNICYRIGNGFYGWKKYAPYDAVIAAAAPQRVPGSLLSQLADGGRLVIPLGAAEGIQTLYKYIKKGKDIHKEAYGPVRFVPLVDGDQ